MARLSTCKMCNKKITKEEKIMVSNKPYCLECGEKLKQEAEEYKQLIDHICEYYQIQCCTGLMLRQIKEYKEKFQYTYNGMLYTLWFVKEIERRPFNEVKYGVAYIKYYYEKAKEYFEQQNKISESVKKIENKNNIKTVKIKSTMQNEKGKDFLFNINSLFEGGK